MVLMEFVDRPDGSKEIIYRKTCPWKDVTDHTNRLIQYYRFYDKGLMLEEGGVSDQPAWYIEAMVYMDGRMGHWQKDASDRAREKAKSDQRAKFKR